MTDEERLDSEESEDVEAHRRRALADEAAENDEDKEEGDDVEAHRRRA
jgi:hypothetical protein